MKSLNELMKLWEGSNTSDELVPNSLDEIGGLSITQTSSSICFPPPQLYQPRSRAFPLLQANPNIWAFTQQVTKEIEKKKKKPEGIIMLQI